MDTKITKCGDIGTSASWKCNRSVEFGKNLNWLQYTQNRVAWPTSIKNSAFMLVIVATPVNCAPLAAGCAHLWWLWGSLRLRVCILTPDRAFCKTGSRDQWLIHTIQVHSCMRVYIPVSRFCNNGIQTTDSAFNNTGFWTNWSWKPRFNNTGLWTDWSWNTGLQITQYRTPD